MSALKPGTYLLGGTYKILQTLGQGGFGITYLAEQVFLEQKVCIKEFFIKQYCERNDDSCSVTLGTKSVAPMMDRYKAKFIKEARTIYRLQHPNIIRIHNVFEENNTAYYVMDYIEGMSLNELIERSGPLPEERALGYVRQVAGALEYLHARKMMHLDVKPANMMLSIADDRILLIDFGLAKQYDSEGGQTSSTPVGVSAGYAPIEQYQTGGVSEFSPQTDIYSLGASLYKLLTGNTPPDASMVVNRGLPALPASVSPAVGVAISAAMRPSIAARPATVEAFLALLADSGRKRIGRRRRSKEDSVKVSLAQPEEIKSEETVVEGEVTEPGNGDSQKPESGWRKLLIWVLAGIVLVAGVVYVVVDYWAPVQEERAAERARTVVTDFSVERQGDTLLMRIEGRNLKDFHPRIMMATSGLIGLDTLRNTIRNLRSAEVRHKKQVPTDTLWYKVPFDPNFVRPRGFGENFVTLSVEGYSQFGDISLTASYKYELEAVDLGLSVKWASCNLGAILPEDSGDYFAWGEVEPKTTYSWQSYTWSAGDSDFLTKYCPTNLKQYWTKDKSVPDGKTKLELSDDAARQKLGGSWRMPTKAEFEELIKDCNWRKGSCRGRNGYYVEGKQNHGRIFLPVTGYYGKKPMRLEDLNKGYYWTSSLDLVNPGQAYDIFFTQEAKGQRDSSSRFAGFVIRPVLK